MSAPSEQGKNLVDRALEGKANITSADFHSFVGDYIRQENARNMQKTECTIDKPTLDFELGGRPYPVVEFNDKRCVQDSFGLVNNGKKQIYYWVTCAESKKFDLQIDPADGKIKKGETAKIALKLRVFCTTKIYPIMKIVLSHEKPQEKKSLFAKGKTPSQSGTLRRSPESPFRKEDEIGSLLLCWKIESDLSLSLDFDEIKLRDKIGEGGYGTVYLATWRGNECAVKTLAGEDMVDEERELVKRELDLLGKLVSPYVVTYMGSTIIPGQPLCLVMEYVKYGSLTQLLKQDPNLDTKFRSKLVMDVAKGMGFLHSNSIYHRDLKPDNMLVISPFRNNQINLKITDFGTSRASQKKSHTSGDYLSFTDIRKDLAKKEEIKPPTKSLSSSTKPGASDPNKPKSQFKLTKGVGTLIYQAPELLSGKAEYSIDKTDVFSFGVLVWQVFTGKEPFSEGPFETTNSIIDFVTSGNRLKIPQNVPKRIKTLIERCWHHDPQARPAFPDIVKELEDIYNTLDDVSEDTGTPKQPRVPIPNCKLSDVGWSGSIDRTQAEAKLRGCPPQTFLIRWSENTKSYVLSYSTDKNKYQHIAYIRPERDSSITVDKQDGTVARYDSLLSYIKAMKENGIISMPVAVDAEDLYERSPGQHQ